MDISLLYLTAGLLVSFLAGWISIPRIVLIAKRKRIFDTPCKRKIHTGQIPRLGGISFMPAILLAFFLVRGIQGSVGGAQQAASDGGFQHCMFYFLAGLIMIYLTGLWDDIAGLSYKYKLGAQLFVALLLVLPAGSVDNLQGLFGVGTLPHWLSFPLSVLTVMVVINAFNMIDGMDGLCSGLSAIAFLTLGALLAYGGETLFALLAAVTIGVVIPFFIYNCYGRKLKIFMGDCGSLTLGYIAAFLLLQLAARNNSAQQPVQLTLVTLMSIVFVPLFDTLRLFIQRLWRGNSPFLADRNHIHHKLLRLGYSQRKSLRIILSLQVFFIVSNFLLASMIDINFLFAADFALAALLIVCLDRRALRRQRRTAVLSGGKGNKGDK